MKSYAQTTITLLILSVISSVGCQQLTARRRGGVERVAAGDSTLALSAAAAAPTSARLPSDAERGVRAKLRQLASLPVGLKVIHSPNPASARQARRGRWAYYWPYQTTVRAIKGSVRIEEFGALALTEGSWGFSTVTGEPYTPRDFGEWYSCPQAVVPGGGQCSDPKNWSGRDELQESLTRWYFIGVDDRGRRVKGEAVIKHRAVLE